MSAEDGSHPEMGAASDPEVSRELREQARTRVRALLFELGASEREIDEAEQAEAIDLLVVDRMLFPAGVRYTQREVAEQTGLSLDVLRRFWRALGFLDVADDDRTFTDLDIEAVQLFQDLLRSGVVELEHAVHLARVIGSSMARIADAEVVPRSLHALGPEDPVMAADAFSRLAGPAIPSLARLLEFVWRRHLQAASVRTMMLRTRGTVAGANPALAVGFADMVGFTLLSQHLSQIDLAEVVQRFDELAYDIVTGLGGRVVKTIGDEAMFVVHDPEAAARIALGLADAYADDELLSDVRVGLAAGPVVTRDGDYFGTPVNLAHRIVNIADPGTVLASDELWSALQAQSPGTFRAEAMRPRILKDLGRVQVWRLSRAGEGIPDADRSRQRSRRWERVAEILREVDELRVTGERAVSSGLLSSLLHSAGTGEGATPHSADHPSAAGDGRQSPSALGEAQGGDPPGPEGEGASEGTLGPPG